MVNPFFSGHGFLQVFDLAVVKFHNFPTSCTKSDGHDGPLWATLSNWVLGSEMTFFAPSRCRKKSLRVPIDRGEDRCGGLFWPRCDITARPVDMLHFQERGQNEFSLTGQLEGYVWRDDV